MAEFTLKWVLKVFSRETDRLVAQHDLVGVTTEEARTELAMPPEDAMADVYPVGERQAAWVERRASVRPDFDRYVYFAKQSPHLTHD